MFWLHGRVYALCLLLMGARRGRWIPWNGTCELLRGYWKSNLGPPGEQQALLASEPSLQP